ncbi:hypothetical protein GRAN_3171 [Granulicella sibirica]|uniref:Uncharacterized protein n=1 Tax=Granulicella sibirica TaxID=2479048 RepID=A0A4V1L5M8_9BACT|nr:hypothetical protein GRAN_3171 [Granulicella sibirica]
MSVAGFAALAQNHSMLQGRMLCQEALWSLFSNTLLAQ